MRPSRGIQKVEPWGFFLLDVLAGCGWEIVRGRAFATNDVLLIARRDDVEIRESGRSVADAASPLFCRAMEHAHASRQAA